MEELWHPVTGYEGLYEVSDAGDVRSLRSRRLLTAKTKGSHGYPMVSLSRDGFSKMFLVHRLVALAFLGEPEEGQEVCHEDGRRDNPSLSNLRWDSRSNNARDRAKHGTHYQALKTHCPLQHPLSGDNLVASHPGRKCRACASARAYARGKQIPMTKDLADSYYERYAA